MSKKEMQVVAALGIIVPEVGKKLQDMQAKVCGVEKKAVVRDENGRYRVGGKFVKATPEVKVAVLKQRAKDFKNRIENLRAAGAQMDEYLYSNVDDIEANDNRKRQNELGLTDKMINDENRISMLDSWIMTLEEKIADLLKKIDKELEKDYPAIAMMLLSIKSKADAALDKAKEEYRRTREWQAKNAWQLTSKPHANDIRWVENSLDILAGEGGWCRKMAKLATSRYESFVEDMGFCEAFGIDDVAYMQKLVNDAKGLIAKLSDDVSYIAKAIDGLLAEDDSPLKAWELAQVQRTMDSWDDEELVMFINCAEGGKGKLLAQEILMERLVARKHRLSFKALCAMWEVIDDAGSTQEDRIRVGQMQAHAKKLDWEIKKAWQEAQERMSTRKATTHKYAVERIVAAGDEDLDPVVDYIKVEEFYFTDDNGVYLPISHTVVRPIYRSELPFIEEIKKGSTASLFSFQGSLPKTDIEKIGLKLAMSDDLFIQNAD
jgi:chaperonin cofactor prefoldin